jgi:hypothetical protein
MLNHLHILLVFFSVFLVFLETSSLFADYESFLIYRVSKKRVTYFDSR